MLKGTRFATAVAVLAGGACLLNPGSAAAHTSRPSAPSGLHVVRVSPNSFTIKATGQARKFRLYAAYRRHALGSGQIASAKRSHLRRTPTLTIKDLHYTTKPFYYRVEARNGTHRRFSNIEGTVNLKPATPTDLSVTSDQTGLSLSWDSAPATGFQILQATDAAMTQDVHTYTTENEDHTFSPYGLGIDSTYYFQVRALNGTTPSAATGVVSATAHVAEQPVRAMTFNVLEATADGRSEGGNSVAPWSQRRIAASNVIHAENPDVVSIQEGSSWVAGIKGPRQVDDLVTALGGDYSLADTEVPPSQPHYMRTGCYILYKGADYTPVGPGGHFDLGDHRFAAYQVLANNLTGAQFLFVAPHLMVTKGGTTDQSRYDETKSMVEQAKVIADPLGVPVVYAGDFNSDLADSHSFNGPSDYMLPNGMVDSFDAAQSRTNAQYDSANNYRTTPPAHHLRIDYLYVSPGVGVDSWDMHLDLNHGKQAGVIPSDHNAVTANLLIPYSPVS